ncbi:MAG: DNA polymerase I [Acidimicrobiales bacterium]|nr:DNA polymerase I [Acidimicrobiales bacterium]
MPDLMIIDGNSLTYRAFFALPPDMATSKGQTTNAIYGFASMLVNLIKEQQPKKIVVAFDRPEKTFRHKKHVSYKANRDKQPDILYEQIPLVKEMVSLLGYTVIDIKGFEADDIIATLATIGRDAGEDVVVVTGDRDVFQLVEDPHVKVLYNKKGVSDYALYDEEGIFERTGVTPENYVNYAALRGDTSDNLPGVPGVGEKTAAKLINTYGNLEGIFSATSEQTPKLKQNLEENEGLAHLNAELMTLIRDVPLEVKLEELENSEINETEINDFLDALELNTLKKRLSEAVGFEVNEKEAKKTSKESVLDLEYENCTDALTAHKKIEELIKGETVSIAESSTQEGNLTGLAVGDSENCYWFSADVIQNSKVATGLNKLLSSKGPGVAVHDGKKTYRQLSRCGVSLQNITLDVTLAQYLLEPSDSLEPLSEILSKHTNLYFPSEIEKEGQLNFDSENDQLNEAVVNAKAIVKLHEPLKAALKANGLEQLNEDVEIPLVSVLAEMETRGIAVDVAELQRLRDEFTNQCEGFRTEIHNLAGEEFNVNSTKQLREILFEKLSLAPGKKTKTGYSTDAATLEKLRDSHPIVEKLLSYREVEKLRSTYGEGLLSCVDEDNRIRATFHQTVTRTGRLSSDAPNLHNIPVRTETGKAFRKAFIPAEKHSLLVADYNQIELRCIAHLADEKELKSAFNSGQDIHTAVASRTWGIKPEEIDSTLRNRAKMVSYGLAYGMEAYGLAQRLDIPVDEASEILKAFFNAFPGVKDYMNESIEKARKKGYTETLLGRRRKIPELLSTNFNVRQAGERQAMNAPIQGLAADIFKIALVTIDQELQKESYKSALVLQVHDEVILEVANGEMGDIKKMVEKKMENAYDLSVELKVDIATGKSWAEAKG